MHRLLFVVAMLGCSRASEENLGLGERTVAVDVTRLDRAPELLRALALGGAELDRRLGARRVEARSTLEVAAGGRAPEKLEETFILDSDGAGAVHLVHDNSRGAGMEAIAVGGELYTRPRHGKLVRRRPEGDDVERLRQLVERAPHGTFEALARFAEIKDAGTTTIAGKNARKLQLTLAASPADAPTEIAPGRKWRETLSARILDGEVAVEPQSGALLAARLEASYSFTRFDEKEPVSVTLHFSYDTKPAAPIAAPVESVAAPRRPRPLLDKQALLEGISK